jgi:alkanesulfonate monooxygenase SsuD/methylene tetrahydromethanopterin reductase-like flavin-dependent oxidoreductase (luciferase family)
MQVETPTPQLKFGVHLSGAGDPAPDAQLAESLGFDMVAVDRDVLNGAPASLEMWTTLTWVAAHTSTVTIVPNVLALPNRHPALLAKMAETLDRLSGGRLVLALGAGAPMNDPHVRSLGLHTWSRAERVEAAAEALDVIRGLWSNAAFSYAGKYFVADQADLEPKPVRHIPIWLGAYKHRMLDLTGRGADGWVPSFFLLEPEAAYRARDRVRAAAERAGRDPEVLTFAYNVGVSIDDRGTPVSGQLVGGVEKVAEQLAALVDHGFRTLLFWLSGDRREQMTRLAREVIPTVRAHADL